MDKFSLLTLKASKLIQTFTFIYMWLDLLVDKQVLHECVVVFRGIQFYFCFKQKKCKY